MGREGADRGWPAGGPARGRADALRRGRGVTDARRPNRQPVQARCYAFDEETAPLFVDDVDNPYSHPPEKPFDWIRSRQVGGRLLLWDRMCLRMSDHELKAASRDGVGDDWPISYEDLRPHYDRVERFLGVCGHRGGRVANVPDGEFVAPPPLSAGERQFKQAVEGRWPERRS